MALIDWGNNTAAETYRGRMDSVLSSLIAVGASITPASPEGDPLRLAWEKGDSILAKALVRRGASDAAWSPDERKAREHRATSRRSGRGRWNGGSQAENGWSDALWSSLPIRKG